MKMRCFCVPIVSLSFWIPGVITVCGLCDPRVLYDDVCVCVCVCARALASVSVFVCVLTRELRTKRVREEGFVCCEGSAATHI